MSSHPSRGAWIEIAELHAYLLTLQCRTPRGVRGLKFGLRNLAIVRECRTPRGVRGLKYQSDLDKMSEQMSHPSRGAWIEIVPACQPKEDVDSRTPRGVRGLK